MGQPMGRMVRPRLVERRARPPGPRRAGVPGAVLLARQGWVQRVHPAGWRPAGWRLAAAPLAVAAERPPRSPAAPLMPCHWPLVSRRSPVWRAWRAGWPAPRRPAPWPAALAGRPAALVAHRRLLVWRMRPAAGRRLADWAAAGRAEGWSRRRTGRARRRAMTGPPAAPPRRGAGRWHGRRPGCR